MNDEADEATTGTATEPATEPQLRAAPPVAVAEETALERYARAAFEGYMRSRGDPADWTRLQRATRMSWEAAVHAVFIEHARSR